MDIRNYFTPLNHKKKDSEQKVKKRRNIIDSDEEEPLPSRKKVLAPDSDEEVFEIKCKSKLDTKSNSSKASKSKALIKKPSPPKLKPKSAAEYFGGSSVHHSIKQSSKRKVEEFPNIQSDESFEKTLKQLDEAPQTKKIKKEDISRHNYSQRENQDVKKGLASKLSERMREIDKKIIKEEKKNRIPTEDKKNIEERNHVNPTSVGKSPRNVILENSKNENSPKKIQVKKSPKKQRTPSKVEIEYKKNPTPTKKKSNENNLQDEEQKQKSDLPTSEIEIKKQRSVAFRNFMNRSGPKNPGSKPIPEGEPNCLSGMTFVITGVLDSIDREEASDLIKKHGGKVTTSVSKNTTYLVIGEEPGASKTSKAEKLGTKLLNEDELFDLIQKQPSRDDDTSSSILKVKGKKGYKSSLGQFAKENKDISSKKLFIDTESSSDSFFKSPSTSTKSLSTLSSPSSVKSSPSSLKSCSQSTEPFSSQDLESRPSDVLMFKSSPSSLKSCSQSTEPLSSQDLESRPSDVLMFVDRYRPTSLKNVIGQQGEQSNSKKLLNWLRSWTSNQSGTKKLVRPSPWAKDNTGAYFKAALLSGPPGVGKTTTAHLVSKELGFDVVELNASDTRSKKALTEEVSQLLTSKSLAGYASDNSVADATSRKRVLLMDEVDGMAGNEDRGGVQELIALIKSSKVPVICMCNDRNHPKIRSLASHCFDLRFHKPRLEQIRGAMMSVCYREGIKIKPEALDQMIIGSNQDIRQVLHHLSIWSVDEKILDSDSVKKDSQLAKKEFKLGPWDVCMKVFSESAHKDMNIHEKVSLFFHDYSIGPLFVQENYLKVSPHCARGNRNKLLEQVAKTANVLADSDIIDKAIRTQSAWSLLPTQALFSSVCPGNYMEGHLSAQVEFPKWLGNNSKKNKFDRISQELLTHMRLRISASKQDIITDYSSHLRDAVVNPLISKGAEGVAEAVSVMVSNDLLREDLESILELSSWPGTKDKMASIESKVKAAFTRTFNKEAHMTPFSTVSIAKKSSRVTQDDLELLEEEGIGEEEEEEEDDDDITKGGMIKIGKHSQQKASKNKGKESTSKGKGRGKK